MVDRRKLQIKEEIVMGARKAFDAHVAALNAEIAPMRLPAIATDFVGAIKGKKSLGSIRDALDHVLTVAKIAADADARAIRANLGAFQSLALDDDFGFLFADLSQLVHKPADDFEALVRGRILTHKAAEERKAREKAEADARAAEQRRLAEEAAERQAAEAAQRQQEAAAAEAQNQAAAALEAAQRQATPAPATASATQPRLEPPPAPSYGGAGEHGTLTLGDICMRLGFFINYAFVAETLRIECAGRSPSMMTPLYSESDFRRICVALVAHIGSVQELHPA